MDNIEPISHRGPLLKPPHRLGRVRYRKRRHTWTSRGRPVVVLLYHLDVSIFAERFCVCLRFPKYLFFVVVLFVAFLILRGFPERISLLLYSCLEVNECRSSGRVDPTPCSRPEYIPSGNSGNCHLKSMANWILIGGVSWPYIFMTCVR